MNKQDFPVEYDCTWDIQLERIVDNRTGEIYTYSLSDINNGIGGFTPYQIEQINQCDKKVVYAIEYAPYMHNSIENDTAMLDKYNLYLLLSTNILVFVKKG